MVRIDEKYKITWEEYYKNTNKYDLIDIRKEKLYILEHVKGSRNIQIDSFSLEHLTIKNPVIFCTRGISAQSVAKALLEKEIDCRIIKGLLSFKKEIDEDFPL